MSVTYLWAHDPRRASRVSQEITRRTKPQFVEDHSTGEEDGGVSEGEGSHQGALQTEA
jgi:hypothetical protein